jgi:hypothetical protein
MAENEVRSEGLGYHVQSHPPVGNEAEFHYVTAKTFPLGDDGKFQSEPAEACYEQAKVMQDVSREQMLQLINNSGIASQLTDIKRHLLASASSALFPDTDSKSLSGRQRLENLLNSVGPAAAEAVMAHTLTTLKKQGLYQDAEFNGSITHNLRVLDEPNRHQPLTNGDSEFGCAESVLREFLLPRYAYLDFDRVVDPRHRIDEECGYPKFVTPIMYRYMYDRDDMARRVVDIYPDETWAVEPTVTDTEDENEMTPFKEDWQRLCEDFNLLSYLYRMDKLSGIGHYGALLMGIADGEDLEAPIDEEGLLEGGRRWVSKKPRELLFLRPFDEYLSFIHQYEVDVLHPRYGLPKFYNLVFLDMTIDAAGASIGTRLNRRVHWSRVVHVADNLQSSLVFGTPRMQPCFNRLLDLRKVKGGSGEMFWKGGFPGVSFEIDPRFVADDPEFDREEFKRTVERYANGLQRYIDLVGIKATSLNPQVADPMQHVMIQLQAIAMSQNVPLRVWIGSEEGRLASSQDKLTWNQRLGRKLRTFTTPNLIRNTVDRFVAVGVMRPPRDNKYWIDWPDLNTPTDEDKANLALKWTQALSQYVGAGVIHLIEPMDYFTQIVGMRPADAKRVLDQVDKNGGFSKLRAVNPDQGAGANGNRENNVTPGEKSGTAGSRPKKRNTADKKAEGSAS